MRFRGSVAIDLGTVNTLVWVAGRGIVLEEPTAIAIDTGVGKVAAVGEAADALADKEPQDIQVIHPLRDGVIADLDATAAMLHAFLRRTRRFSLVRRDALVCVPSGATPVERRSIIAALGVRRPRYNVRLIDEPVAAAAGAGFDLTGGAGGFVVDIGGGTTEDRKSTRLNSSHRTISYAVFCLKKKNYVIDDLRGEKNDKYNITL